MRYYQSINQSITVTL